MRCSFQFLIELSSFPLRKALASGLAGVTLFLLFDKKVLTQTVDGAVFEFPNTAIGPQARSREELDLFGRVVDATTPAEIITAAESFKERYRSSELLPIALLKEMEAQVSADSYDGAVAIGRELLRRDSKNLGALLLMASVLPNFGPTAKRQPAILSEAEKCVEEARLVLENFHLSQGVPAKTFILNKRRLTITLREAAGFVALVAGRHEDAIQHYEWVLSEGNVQSPITHLRLGLAYYYVGKKEAARQRLTDASRSDSEPVRMRAEKILRELSF